MNLSDNTSCHLERSEGSPDCGNGSHTLRELLGPYLINSAIPSPLITGITNLSKMIKPGFLFLAYKGSRVDGRNYIKEAIDCGAAAVAYEADGMMNLSDGGPIPLIPIFSLEKHLGEIASAFYDYPSKKVHITGVTGTNGKTTIAFQLAQAHELLNQPSAYLGTLGQGTVGQFKKLDNTTPDALVLQSLLYEFYQQHKKQICMEVSSHALTLERVNATQFEQAIFTNLTHDHLDFHQTMEKYALAKAQLFMCNSLKTAIINKDSEYADFITSRVTSGCKVFTYGLHPTADVYILNSESSMQGSGLTIQSPWGTVSFAVKALGSFNIYNTLAVFTSLMASGLYSLDAVVKIMPKLNPAPGRMEIVANAPCVVVDYAHTPDALENVLKTLVALKKHKLWVVFGCGGDRDKTKRPEMGAIAEQYADNVIITNDNPRSEDPTVIADEILRGCQKADEIQVILDRKLAIASVLEQTNQDDIILIAGKGHEDYQIIGSEKRYFSDQDEVKAWTSHNM